MSRRHVAGWATRLACLIAGWGFTPAQAQQPGNDPALAVALEQIRAKYDMPALAGAVFNCDGIVAEAAVGVRKRGTDTPVTLEDQWHLGSDTKMMTATLAGMLVAEGKLSWDDKVISYFPELAQKVPPAMKEITLRQVLGHQAGLRENLDWWEIARTTAITDQRRVAVEQALTSPAFAPGTYHYANTDYVVIGAVLEKIAGESWEELMQKRVFQPLKMTSAGFGGTGTQGMIDQPWPHFENGTPASFNGPQDDPNPRVMAPAGAVHCDLDDWVKFLTDQLRGACGQPVLMPAMVYQTLQTAQPNSDYGMGWIVVQRSWAGGKALNHGGSNTMNYALCWLAPGRKFGVAVCCNQGGAKAFEACDTAVGALIKRGEF